MSVKATTEIIKDNNGNVLKRARDLHHVVTARRVVILYRAFQVHRQR